MRRYLRGEIPFDLRKPDGIIEKEILRQLSQYPHKIYRHNLILGEISNVDLEKVTSLFLDKEKLTDLKGLPKLSQLTLLRLDGNQLTDVKDLPKLPQLKDLDLNSNKLTEVKGLEKLTQLTKLSLEYNSDLTKAQIAELEKAFPKCKIYSNPSK